MKKSKFLLMLVDHNFMLVLLLLSAVDRGTDHGELLNSEYVPCCVVCGPGLVGRESRSGGPGIGLKQKVPMSVIF